MKLEDVKKLNQKKYRAHFGYYLVEGEHLILELQKAELQKANLQKANLQKADKAETDAKHITLYVSDDYVAWANQLDIRFSIITLSQKQMTQLSDTKTPQGIIACVPLPSEIAQSVDSEQSSLKPATSKQKERYVYLHEVQDPGNLGTILRTLAWFGNFRLLLSPNSVDPFNPKVVRASMGAIFHVPIEVDIELSELGLRFTKFAYLDMHGGSVNSAEFAHYDCYLFGNEARGVPRASLSAFNASAFTIEGSGNIDSLNLASAVNICVYQLSINQ